MSDENRRLGRIEDLLRQIKAIVEAQAQQTAALRVQVAALEARVTGAVASINDIVQQL